MKHQNGYYLLKKFLLGLQRPYDPIMHNDESFGKILIKNIRPGSTLGVFKINDTPKLTPIYVNIVFWDHINVEAPINTNVLIRIITSQLRVASPRAPFELEILIDGDKKISVFDIKDASQKNQIPIPQICDSQILGGLIEWAKESYGEVKLDPLTPYVIMIKSAGTIHYENGNIHAVNRKGRTALILADPDLFYHLGEFLNV